MTYSSYSMMLYEMSLGRAFLLVLQNKTRTVQYSTFNSISYLSHLCQRDGVALAAPLTHSTLHLIERTPDLALENLTVLQVLSTVVPLLVQHIAL